MKNTKQQTHINNIQSLLFALIVIMAAVIVVVVIQKFYAGNSETTVSKASRSTLLTPGDDFLSIDEDLKNLEQIDPEETE